MNLTSTTFEHEHAIPVLYTCDGRDVNPPLTISDVPEEAQTLALIVDDPDSPTGTWLHWSVWNISRTTQTIEEGIVPPGATEGETTFGAVGYGGPCPHAGEHRYFFTLYALDTALDLSRGASRADLESAMEGHILAQAKLMGKYVRA